MSSFLQGSEHGPTRLGTAPLGVRLAIISTPRSGNTWLRHLLCSTYSATDMAVHNPADLDRTSLPEDCVLQIHWPLTTAFLGYLTRHRFHIVVLARHPLDVLLSILHYATHDDSTLRWLEGAEGNESAIIGAMPCNAAFLDYATGRRAAALLSISRQWWEVPHVHTVHYERLAADPLEELTRLVTAVGVPARQQLAEAVKANSFSALRSQCNSARIPESDHHYWQGKPGHWKRLLTAEAANSIGAAHAEVFKTLNYDCDPDLSLNRTQADANWIEIAAGDLKTKLWGYAPMKLKLEQALEQQRRLETQLRQMETSLKSGTVLLSAAPRMLFNLSAGTAKRALTFMKRLAETNASSTR